MQRNQSHASRSSSALRFATAIVLTFMFATAGHPRPAGAVTATVLMGGVKPATSYDIIRDGVPITTGASTEHGSLAFAMDITSGTLVAIAPLGDLAPPAPPLFTSLDTEEPGCATAQWIPSGDPIVIGYIVAYGRQSVAGGDAPDYDNMIEVGAVSSLDVCSLPLGMHYFALRAKNIGGMLSGYSSELSVEIIVVSVLISHFSAKPASDGVHLSWRVEADEVVRGFRVFRSSAADLQRELTNELLPPDVTSFVDMTAEPGVAYTYMVAAVKENGDQVQSIPIIVATAPLSFDLLPNVPNPFNPSTRIAFTLPEAERAVVRVYDVRGARVATLLDSRLGAGRHEVDWNGVDDGGTRVASGTYFYTLAAGKRTESRKMVLVK
jgi:hypothetical protein